MQILRFFLFCVGGGGVCFGYYLFKRRLLCALVSIIYTLAAVSFLLAGSVSYFWLGLFGVEGNAIVVKLDCEYGKKKHVYYKFNDGGVSVFGVSADGYGNKGCENIKIGEVGSVYYVPGAAVSVWGNPIVYIKELIVCVGFMFIVIPPFTYFSIKKRWEKDR